MNNDTSQAAEAPISQPPRPSIDPVTLHAKSTPKDTLTSLTHDLHTLILITISAVYCLDCFSLLYLLRFFSQTQANTVGIRVVLTANITCILTHIFHSLPQPERHAFWNHGGLLVDFVGEKPASRFKLLLLDFLIFALQVLYLSLYYKKISLTSTAQPAQDLDAEEAGISRTDAPEAETEEGIEMTSLLPDGSEERTAATRVQDECTIILRKPDLKLVFWGPVIPAEAGAATGQGAAGRVQLFFQRLEAIRARRQAQETQA